MIARILILTCLAAAPLMAQAGFPGLQAILTPAEWKRAGLDRLTPDQIGVIDAALIRHQAATNAAINPGSPEAPAGATPAEAALHRARYWENFGRAKVSDWRNEPPMKAKVTGWQGANRFALDTGQVWEGLEPIPFELPGESVVIEARPLGGFVLRRGEDSMAVRVRRVH